MKSTQTAGVTLVEIIIGVTILAAVVVTVAITMSLFSQSSEITKEKVKALYLAEEGIAFLQHNRNTDWNSIGLLTNGTTYYFATSSSAVTITTTPETLPDGYTRSFVLESVYRDGNNDIVASTTPGASPDTDAKVAVMSVSVNGRTVQLSSFLTNVYDE